MGNCCRKMGVGKFEELPNTVFGDEFFTHFPREAPAGKMDPVLSKMENEYLMQMMKRPKILNFKKDPAGSRP
jgi:hypothetical protein